MATQPGRCLDLSDPRARDPAVAGAKAAGLASAAAEGLPTLPGVVVPVDESAAVVRVASTALHQTQARGHGIGRARLAAMTVRPDEPLVAELRDRSSRYPRPLIVRSSSPLESDGTWSGAFSSFHGVRTEDLGTAVRGCWGSAFQAGVLERARHVGVDPTRLGLAVLVQPELAPDVGGIARRRSDGSVRITATRGPLEPLMAGHVEGTSALVAKDGRVDADNATRPGDLGCDLLLEVAALSRRVHRILEHRVIEWAAVDGEVRLLQSIRSSDLAEPEGDTDVDPALTSDVARRVAALTQRFPGRLGGDLVLPWAVAADRLDRQPNRIQTDTPTSTDPVSLLAAARVLAAELTTWVWDGSPRAAAAKADRVLRLLRGDEPAAAVAMIQSRPGPSPETAERLLANLSSLQRIVSDRGLIDADSFWRLHPDRLDRALRDGIAPVPIRLGVDAWEPFAHRVVMATGTGVRGAPAAPGAGVGRAYAVDSPAPAPTGRRVLVASQPLPSIAPLLWNAAGLVTRAGNTAAHLIEFAHSIGVPTVVGCELPDLDRGADPPVLAVDGDRGRVGVAWLR